MSSLLRVCYFKFPPVHAFSQAHRIMWFESHCELVATSATSCHTLAHFMHLSIVMAVAQLLGLYLLHLLKSTVRCLLTRAESLILTSLL